VNSTAMDVIELECPGCSYLLSLDRGFAGGVCRCSHCGTLMTVPADPSTERAEQLTRPERPDAPGRTGALQQPEQRAETPVDAPSPARPAAPPRPETPGPRATPQPAAVPAPPSAFAAPSQEEVFVTPTGRVVRVDSQKIITAKARRRALIRGTTAVVFFIGLGLVVALAIWLFILLLNSLDGRDQGPITPTAIGYRATVNPLLSAQPNLLGVEMENRTVVLIDMSGFSAAARWMPIARDALQRAVAGLGPNQALQVVLFRDGEPRAFPDTLRAWTARDRNDLENFLMRTPMMGVADPLPAMELAAKAQPDAVIVITSQRFTEEKRGQLAIALAAGGRLKFHYILIGADDPPMRAVVERFSGRYLSMLQEHLDAWQTEAAGKP
jgi:hypothetical protein